MKRIFFLLIASLLIVSCKERYIQIIHFEDTNNDSLVYHFKAFNHEKAFLRAYKNYCYEQKFSQYDDSFPKPTSFDLRCSKDDAIIDSSVTTTIKIESVFKECYGLSRQEYANKVHEEKQKKEAEEEALRIEKARIDSLSLIAWGDAKFGMSRKEVNATNLFKGMWRTSSVGTSNWVYETPSSTTNKIKKAFNLSYEPTLYAEFNGADYNELVQVVLKSRKCESRYFDLLIWDCEKLSKFITDSYGEPIKLNLDYKAYDVHHSVSKDIGWWHIGNKIIDMTVLETYDYRFCYQIKIYNRDYPKKKNTELEEERTKRKKEVETLKKQMF